MERHIEVAHAAWAIAEKENPAQSARPGTGRASDRTGERKYARTCMVTGIIVGLGSEDEVGRDGETLSNWWGR